MSHSLYVSNLPPEITIDRLIIYFQSETNSGGGDVDFEACKLDGDKAVVVFEKTEGNFIGFNRSFLRVRWERPRITVEHILLQ